MGDADRMHDGASVPARSIRVDYVGDEGEPVVVVEHFSPHPERLIADAEGLDFQPMGEFYPGVRAPVRSSYFEGLSEVIAPVMRHVFGASDRAGFTRALYSIATTPPADLTLGQRIPHVDETDRSKIAIIHYLSHRDLGGTAFYRHRSTGFETLDPGRRDRYFGALHADFATHGEPAPAYIEGDTPIFEEIARYAGAFNRALIYRSSLLHCGLVSNAAPPSRDIRAGRLTVASFLTAV